MQITPNLKITCKQKQTINNYGCICFVRERKCIAIIYKTENCNYFSAAADHLTTLLLNVNLEDNIFTQFL